MTGKVKVLLVEDLAIPAKVAIMLLERKGCHVDWVSHGKEAIEHANKGYHFILLDLGLPDIDGYEVAKTIRLHHNVSIPIIALTAHADRYDVVLAKEGNINEFLVKPLTAEQCDDLLSRFS